MFRLEHDKIEFADTTPGSRGTPTWLTAAILAERAAVEKIEDAVERRLQQLALDDIEARLFQDLGPSRNSDVAEVAIEHRLTATPASHPATIQRRSGAVSLLSGYAAVFYREGVAGTQYQLSPDVLERILPTAFDRALREGGDVLGLFNHDLAWLLGRSTAGTLRLSVDSRGLKYEIPYDSSDPQHQAIAAKVQRGDLRGSSFSFKPKAQNTIRTANGFIRELTDVVLFDVGPVVTPAYSATTATARMAEPSSEAAPLAAYVAGRSPLAAQVAARLALLERDDNAETARKQALVDSVDGRLWEIFRRPNLSVRQIHNLITAK